MIILPWEHVSPAAMQTVTILWCSICGVFMSHVAGELPGLTHCSVDIYHSSGVSAGLPWLSPMVHHRSHKSKENSFGTTQASPFFA